MVSAFCVRENSTAFPFLVAVHAVEMYCASNTTNSDDDLIASCSMIDSKRVPVIG